MLLASPVQRRSRPPTNVKRTAAARGTRGERKGRLYNIEVNGMSGSKGQDNQEIPQSSCQRQRLRKQDGQGSAAAGSPSVTHDFKRASKLQEFKYADVCSLKTAPRPASEWCYMAAVTFLRLCRHFVRSPRAILTQPGKRIWLLEGTAVNTNRRLPLPLPTPLRLRCPLKAIDWLEAILNHDSARRPDSQRPSSLSPFPCCPAN